MSEETPTVRDRLAGYLSEDRLEGYIAAGMLLLDGEPVTDLDAPASGDHFVISVP
ncbi:MAG: hypothetical protein AB7L91_19655 [Dehalococcoidia bacterium]